MKRIGGKENWKGQKKKNVQDKRQRFQEEGDYNETLKYKEIPLENATYLKWRMNGRTIPGQEPKAAVLEQTTRIIIYWFRDKCFKDFLHFVSSQSIHPANLQLVRSCPDRSISLACITTWISSWGKENVSIIAYLNYWWQSACPYVKTATRTYVNSSRAWQVTFKKNKKTQVPLLPRINSSSL